MVVVLEVRPAAVAVGVLEEEVQEAVGPVEITEADNPLISAI